MPRQPRLWRNELKDKIATFIASLAGGAIDEDRRDALIIELASFQAQEVEPYERICDYQQVDFSYVLHPGQLPAMPTEVFRYVRCASFPKQEDIRVFQTSGTTLGPRGKHSFKDMALYDLAADVAARDSLFQQPAYRVVVLAPREVDAPESSLSYMLSRFVQWFGAYGSMHVWDESGLNAARIVEVLDKSEHDGVSVALLGTSFAFVHARDQLGEKTWRLPKESLVMQTGGFKGKSREVSKEDMLDMLTRMFGVPPESVIAEYGMTELSSQAYEIPSKTYPRYLWFPGWVRATVVSPATLDEVPDGTVGLLRVDDLANLDSVCCIQTADVARRTQEGIELLGRSPGAVPRGCSIAVDAALERI